MNFKIKIFKKNNLYNYKRKQIDYINLMMNYKKKTIN